MKTYSNLFLIASLLVSSSLIWVNANVAQASKQSTLQIDATATQLHQVASRGIPGRREGAGTR